MTVTLANTQHPHEPAIPVTCDTEGRCLVCRLVVERDEAVRNCMAAVQDVAELLALLNTPEVEDFDKAVPLEASHQVQRWGTAHDAGKEPEDWFWLVGYLAGKALHSWRSGDIEKAKHHCISAAAALRNWHAHVRSGASRMRPGTEINDGSAWACVQCGTTVTGPSTSPPCPKGCAAPMVGYR